MKQSWLILLPLLLIPPAWAEEKVRVEGVVVTAARIEETAGETTSEVTVIRSEEIQAMHANLLPEVLRRIPDLNIVQTGGDGKFTSVFLRGGDPKHTLVMVDGVKVNSNTVGSYDMSSLPVDDIERIEIVKGAQSTIYGSEAMAGVINIITKKGEGRPKATITVEAGSQGTVNPSATVSGSTPSLHYRVTAGYFSTDGISTARNGSEKDGYRNGSLSWKAGARPSEQVEVELIGQYSADRSELDGYDFMTGLAADAPNFVQHGIHVLLAARGKLYVRDIWEQVLTLSTFRDSLKFRDPDTDYNNADIVNRRHVIDWQNNLYITNSLTLTGGIEYRRENGENKGNFDETVDNKAAYLNAKLKLLSDALVLNAGIRYDDHESFGSKTTYKVGAAYVMKDAGITLRTSYGTGFRAPSLNDLYYPFYGNPSLKPEESTSFEAGAVKFLLKDRVSLSVTYFSQDYDNLIQSDPRTYTAANIASASVKGIEAAVSWRASEGLDLNAGYTYLDTEDKDTGTELIRRPTHKVSAGAAYSFKDISVRADFLYVGGRLDSSAGTMLSPYALVNLNGSYRMGKAVSVFIRIENLFDTEYEEAHGFGTKGRSLYGGITATM